MARGFLNEIGRLANKLDEFAGAAVNAGVALAAKRIVDDLQKAGPSWTGDFKNNWVVAIGDTDIPATVPRRFPIPVTPLNTPSKPIIVPPLPAKFSINKIKYTIGNRAEYRAIALDLDPGQVRTSLKGGRQPRNTAPKDWFTTYLQGGQINKTIAASLGPELDKVWRKA